jgi:diacylglycerol kinase family enzyme
MDSSEIKKEWLVIVNPNAGKAKGKKDWAKIAGLLHLYNISFKAFFTITCRHAIVLTHEGISAGFRKIIAIGGDGTLNEVVNGVFTQSVCDTKDISLAMITVGTGNDWGKLFGIPVDYEEAVKIIKEYKIRLQDTGIVYYYHGINRESRYFLNIAGIGFDALVVKRTTTKEKKVIKAS